jgi:hypothetical protein
MKPDEEGLALLQQRLGNDFADRLQKFEGFAGRHPEEAFAAAWKFLTEATKEIDDGSCCFVLETSVKAVGRGRVERKILESWQHLGEFARLNIIDGASSQKAMSTELGVALFHHPTTTVRQRHRIVAAFAAGDPGRRVDNLVALANQIGSYPDPAQQATLDAFIASVVRNFR